MENEDAEAQGQEAYALFAQGRYSACLDVLKRLQEKNPKNARVQHNIHITQCLLEGCSREAERRCVQSLLKLGGEALAQRKARRAGDTGGGSGGGGRNDEDVFAVYNAAVLCYQRGDFVRSLQLVDELFEVAQGLKDTSMTVHIAALRLELLVSVAETTLSNSHDGETARAKLAPVFDKASTSFELLDKALSSIREERKGRRKGSSGGDTQDASSSAKQGGVSKTADAQRARILQNGKYLMHWYKSRINLLKGSKKASKREIKSVCDVAEAAPTAAQHVVAASVLKANLQFTRNDYNTALDLVSRLPEACERDEENGGGNAGGVDDDHLLATVYYNNLGCTHYRMKKFNVAAHYFVRALTHNEKAVTALTRDKSGALMGQTDSFALLNVCNMSKSSRVLYNLGVTLMLTRKPDLAFECFQQALQTFRNTPDTARQEGRVLEVTVEGDEEQERGSVNAPLRCVKIWIRLAECCVLSQVEYLKSERKRYKNTMGVTAGNKDRSRLILPTVYTGIDESVAKERGRGGAQPVPYQAKGDDSGGEGGVRNADVAGRSMKYAVQCLRNALVTLSVDFDGADDDAGKGKEGSSSIDWLTLVKENPVTVTLVQGVLLHLAYVALCSSDPISAHQSAGMVLDFYSNNRELGVDDEVWVFANVYSAEAFLMLNETERALPYLLNSLSPPTTSAQSDNRKGLTASQQAKYSNNVKLVVYTNLVTAYIFRGELDRAAACLDMAMGLTNNPSAELYLLQAYLALQRGERVVALQLLKRGRPLPKRAVKK